MFNSERGLRKFEALERWIACDHFVYLSGSPND